jgi:hypothetical protein
MIKLEDIVTNRGERNFSQTFELNGETVSRNQIIPGHYYQFRIDVPNFNDNWIPRDSDEFKENPNAYITNKEYYDLMPAGLVFYHNKWQQTALILNLKVIPAKYRAAIIGVHMNLIEKNLERLGWRIKNKIMSLRDRSALNLAMYRITPSMLEELTGFKLKWAISGYKLDKVVRGKLLDWDNIGELPMAMTDTAGLKISPALSDITSIFNKFENRQLI